MMNESLFPKQIKIDDYEPAQQNNVIRILESSNILQGSGSRTSNSAIVLAKCLHLLEDEHIMRMKEINILELGCGVGLLGIYLACIGANVVMGDVPSMKELAERNINLNKALLKGKIEFAVLNWKNNQCTNKCEDVSQIHQTTSSEKHKEECLAHLISKIDLTILCQCGGLADFQHQLHWIANKGMIFAFLERQYENNQDFMGKRNFEKFLMERQLQFERIDTYHPDYHDERVNIYHIWK